MQYHASSRIILKHDFDPPLANDLSPKDEHNVDTTVLGRVLDKQTYR